ncbi:MAG: hypothetical protein ABGX71_12575 [Methyloprofundus sp.]|uniref:hypothetical protein n=1 Tax=Methyloprofundus sp. TaxID=2020875 RepID=UPI002639D614|nr:hypothetical protein [Methyloprofundus sp.]
MTEYRKDILVGVLFVAGTLGIISGAFIISGMLFAAIAYFSTASCNRQIEG